MGIQRITGNDITKVIDALSKPPPVREKIIGIVFLVLLAVALIACVLFIPASSEIQYGDVTVGGLSFRVPENFDLTESGETASFTYHRYADSYRIGKYKTRRHFTDHLDIYVFNGYSADQALDSFKFGDDKETQRDLTYGNYTGIRVDTIVLPFKNKVPQWFVFEKDGKTVAVYLDNQALFDKALPSIID